MKRLFIDMDGTIARFYEHKQYLEEMFEDGFFRKLRPYKRVILALKKFAKKHPDVEIFILSACCTDKAVREKDEWLDEFYPVPTSNRIFMKVGESKADFVPRGISPEDYLVDDYTKNLTGWVNAGGTGVKIRNELNCQNGTWRGYRISSYDSSDGIVEDLEEILGI